jgi:DivIVA domain-containing protein
MTIEQIVEKEFKKHLSGYNCQAVDQFLDEIIKDYSCFLHEIDRLTEENLSLKKQLKRTAIDNRDMGQMHYDILKRLANLEKKVFQDRLYV